MPIAAQTFEALGVGSELLDLAFVDTPSLVGGVGFQSVAEEFMAWHAKGYPEGDAGRTIKLETWGLYRFAPRR